MTHMVARSEVVSDLNDAMPLVPRQGATLGVDMHSTCRGHVPSPHTIRLLACRTLKSILFRTYVCDGDIRTRTCVMVILGHAHVMVMHM